MPANGSRTVRGPAGNNDSMSRVTSCAGNAAGCLRASSSRVLRRSLQTLIEFCSQRLPSSVLQRYRGAVVEGAAVGSPTSGSVAESAATGSGRAAGVSPLLVRFIFCNGSYQGSDLQTTSGTPAAITRSASPEASVLQVWLSGRTARNLVNQKATQRLTRSWSNRPVSLADASGYVKTPSFVERLSFLSTQFPEKRHSKQPQRRSHLVPQLLLPTTNESGTQADYNSVSSSRRILRSSRARSRSPISSGSNSTDNARV